MMKPATEIKTSHPSRLRSVLAIALFACSPLLAQAKDGGYLNHEAEAQKGDLYAGHFLKKEYAQSRIVNLRDYSNNTWITLEGNIISQTKNKEFVFRDTTGSIPIVVEDSAWHGHEVDAIEVVRVHGLLTRENVKPVMYVSDLTLP
ncbi:NirD/YgiW/YdeI family stress tolerance protein [Citrobacter sp. Cpo221]|uniref:YgiW/YdeI family stress tolerance OB fold protein n=1 Tax=Citrobacter sp. Cpo221 TaxID=2985155 RepID=UPI0025771B85|nr:NirD/YgiW/YdeI family stress tolerance protein [Citrobacter sp. Cpo221]MDM2754090.1 NirD/YgiW/YdeI family stress tolerance protein [Citrobacter sp. Cpo221]